MTDHLEPLVAEQMLDIATRTAVEIVHADDVVALGEQPLAQV